MKLDWIEFGGSLDEFVKQGLFKPGTVIDYQWRKWHDSKEVDGDRDEMMIGHVNKMRGLCECCDIGTGIVHRYAVVLTMEDLQCER